MARAVHRLGGTAAHGDACRATSALLDLVSLLVTEPSRWMMDHQHLTNTFLSNMRGPAERLAFGGASIREIIPVPSTTGNVTVVFAALSYAGVLDVTILADRDRCPDLPRLAAALRTELGALTAPRSPAAPARGGG